MAEYLVTGIAQNSSAQQVEAMVAQHALDAARVAVITKTAQAGGHEGHGMRPGALSSGASIMTGSSGTSVPGTGSSRASLGSYAHDEVPNYLGGLPLIPPDQAEHFNVAIAEGRTLVTYKATPDEAQAVESAFRAAGLRNVKVFKPRVSA